MLMNAPIGQPIAADKAALDDLMTDWVRRIPGATGLLLVSVDGLVRAQSSSLADDIAQPVAAAMTGVRACAGQIGATAGTDALSVAVLDMTGGWVVIANAAAGTLVGVIATRQVTPADISDYLDELCARISDHLTTAPRSVMPGLA